MIKQTTNFFTAARGQTAMPFPPITDFMPLLGIDIEKPKMNMSVYIIFGF